MWPLCDEMKAEPQLNWMSLGRPTVERWLLRFKTAKLGLRAGPSPRPPVCMQTVGQGRAAADCHVMLTARKLYHVHAGLQSHPNLPLQQYLLETLREHFQSFPTAHPRRNHYDYGTLSLYTTSLADAAPGNTRALSSWTSTLPSGEEDEGRLDKMRQKPQGEAVPMMPGQASSSWSSRSRPGARWLKRSRGSSRPPSSGTAPASCMSPAFLLSRRMMETTSSGRSTPTGGRET